MTQQKSEGLGTAWPRAEADDAQQQMMPSSRPGAVLGFNLTPQPPLHEWRGGGFAPGMPSRYAQTPDDNEEHRNANPASAPGA